MRLKSKYAVTLLAFSLIVFMRTQTLQAITCTGNERDHNGGWCCNDANYHTRESYLTDTCVQDGYQYVISTPCWIACYLCFGQATPSDFSCDADILECDCSSR